MRFCFKKSTFRHDPMELPSHGWLWARFLRSPKFCQLAGCFGLKKLVMVKEVEIKMDLAEPRVFCAWKWPDLKDMGVLGPLDHQPSGNASKGRRFQWFWCVMGRSQFVKFPASTSAVFCVVYSSFPTLHRLKAPDHRNTAQKSKYLQLGSDLGSPQPNFCANSLKISLQVPGSEEK